MYLVLLKKLTGINIMLMGLLRGEPLLMVAVCVWVDGNGSPCFHRNPNRLLDFTLFHCLEVELSNA